jgi:hypothetical protein
MQFGSMITRFALRSCTRFATCPGATFALLALVLAAPVAAQEGNQLDRIEVTGARISYRDLLDTPAIALTRRGDYLVQSLTLVNDTRSEEGRRKEIHATIARMIAASGNRFRVQHGDAYPVTLDRGNHAVELASDGKRPDVSRVELQLRAELREGESGEQQVRALREFAQKAELVGRTEIELSADTALGMHRPERYRYELIEAIAADSQRIAGMLGSGCTIALEGLNSRIEWERVGPVELLLYVPYTMSVEGCVAAAR